MSRAIPYREAATVHVRAPPEHVLSVVSDPAVLQALDARIPLAEPLDVTIDGSRVEVRGSDDRIQLTFTMEPEGDGTRLAAAESVRPANALEATKHALFPRKVHSEFKDELGRLKALIEAIGERAPA